MKAPTLKSQPTYVSLWAGLGAFSTNDTLSQDGIDTNTTANQYSYQAWAELCAGSGCDVRNAEASVDMPEQVVAGDVFYVDAQYYTNSNGTPDGALFDYADMTKNDATYCDLTFVQGENSCQDISEAGPVFDTGSSAEWIEEGALQVSGDEPLSYIGSEAYEEAGSDYKGNWFGLGQLQNASVTMLYEPGNVVVADPSAIGSGSRDCPSAYGSDCFDVYRGPGA